MELHVTLGADAPLGAQLYRQLREAILDGRLRPGEALPPTRALAERLAVSRNTVTGAYRRLLAEGFVAGRVGAGTFVARHGEAGRRPRRALAGVDLRPRPAWTGLAREARRAAPVSAAAISFDFGIGVPDASLFPWDAWRRLLSRRLRRARPEAASYSEPTGSAALRDAIARHAGASRSVRAGADDVLVTSGAQQAFDLVARVLVEPGAAVAVEEPGYPPARLAFSAAGARVVPVPVDRDGLVVERLPASARLVYVTPSHQFPLGVPMSLARRRALLAWAERHGAAILEDDYDSEFRFGGRPLEPLQSLDRSGRVLYVGTFSKTLLPSLRVGFLVAPASLAPALGAAKAVADGFGASDVQAALASLLDEGHLARHVRRALRVYRERRERLLEALRRSLSGALEVVPSAAGLHIAALFVDPRVDSETVARRARASRVAVQPLAPYFLGTPRAGLALGFGAIPAARIDEGVRRLAASFGRGPSRA